jgi:hypothetical protein
MFTFRKAAMVAVSVSAILLPQTAYAQNVQIEEVPTNWRLENYPGNDVVIWYVSGPCHDGPMKLDSNATAEDKNRLYSLVLSAKLSNKNIGLYYDPAICRIWSFYIQGG